MGAAKEVPVRLDEKTRTRITKMSETTSRSEEELAREAQQHKLEIQETHTKAIEEAMQESVAGTATHATHEAVMVSHWGTEGKLEPPQCT